MVSGNFYIQSGSPFNKLTPHAVYGNNEGFGFCDDPAMNPTNPGVCVPRGTAIVPVVTATQAGFPNVVDSIGTNRTPTTSNLDLGFYYPIKIGENMEFRLSADWFNVTNAQRAVTLDQTFSINSGVTGVAPVTNPFWGSALAGSVAVAVEVWSEVQLLESRLFLRLRGKGVHVAHLPPSNLCRRTLG